MPMTMNADDIAAVMTNPMSEGLLGSPIPARLAYTGLDGDPRVVPIGFDWDGTRFGIATVPAAPKVKALKANPKVAITIDTEQFPPHILLVRGTAQVDVVDGVPDFYVRASKKSVPPEDQASWEAGVRSLYKQMAVIMVTPTWAKLIDFETTLPKAVEDLVRAQSG
jgi:hypothetical protein